MSSRKDRLNYKNLIVLVIMSLLLIMLMISFAWYLYRSLTKIKSEDRDVMSPYYLYLLDEAGEDYFNLLVGNLHPGQRKQIIVCVSNEKPDDEGTQNYSIGKETSFNYELELAYTKNLPLNYRVYQVEDKEGTNPVLLSADANSVSISAKNNEEMYGDELADTVNKGQYDVYTNHESTKFELSINLDDEGKPSFEKDYYMIELEWKEGIDFSDYLKETDLVYVIVNAMQLEPEEK